MSPFEQFEESLEAAVPDEETLAHLCSVALEKCQDKAERRRAGCGGAAMRRRFVVVTFFSLFPAFSYTFSFFPSGLAVGEKEGDK